MKIDNQSFGFDNASCGALENPLFASSAAGWRRGYAADCKSVQPNHANRIENARKALSSEVEKTTGHFANQDGTLKTLPGGWWIVPSMLCGALVWVYIAAGWL